MNENESLGIAIIGLSGRFPGATNIDEFWELLKHGHEAIINFSDQELLSNGVDPELLQNPHYVKAGTFIEDIDSFDANFFEMNGRDAQISDPQQRLFMETVWQVLEQAGYPPTTTDSRIGIYAGITNNTYQRYYLKPHWQELLATVGEYRLMTLNEKDFVATHTAYKLNLKGPAVTIQTACSTSLVAVHIACQSLLNFESDLAVSGSASLFLPQKQGYLYQEGMILSPDGHCRAFDAKAQGTVVGGGVGVVLLKRLDEALEDGDTIHGVILGSAINNDGSDKIGYTAPSVSGQSDVILEAQSAAGIDSNDISYIETHGTGTALGDPIEIEALTQAFKTHTQRHGYCAIASVKTNIGHADTTAGIAGLIKTVLALKYRQIPASINYTTPNPKIDFANSPFFVNKHLKNWEVEGNKPRYAGVSSFGIGGTNAHVILTEAPQRKPSSSSRPLQLITLSAKTATALDSTTYNLAKFLEQNSQLFLPDVAYTLNKGRQSFIHRRLLVSKDIKDTVEKLSTPENLYTQTITEKEPKVVFLFPGQGSQYLNMTGGLYNSESVFRETLDQCAVILLSHLGKDLRSLLYSDHPENKNQLQQTAITQPVLFAVEYSIAKLWMSWGVKPQAMLGHSIGEYVAACLAGVFSLEDALSLITFRGKLIQSLPSSAMLAVKMSAESVQSWLTPDLSLAVVNGVNRCVLSGSHEEIKNLQQKLENQGISCRQLHTSHGFHSHLMEPILAPFANYLKKIKLNPPTLPYLSNLTGTWITEAQATEPNHWVSHLRHTVKFKDNLQALFQWKGDIFLEVGPSSTLSTLTQQHPDKSPNLKTLSSLPRSRQTDNQAEKIQLLTTLGQLWANNVSVDWDNFYSSEKRYRLPLPTYPFERQRYWIDVTRPLPQAISSPEKIAKGTLSPATVANTNISKTDIKREFTPFEQKIAQIWTQCLGISNLSVDTDFFEVGGDSLLATQLITLLNTQLNIDLDTHSLLQAPTIAELTLLINQKNQQLDTETSFPNLVVKIQAGNPTWKPLILMHPVGGHVYFYRELAHHLDSQLPIYGIRAQGVEGEAAPLRTIPEMVEVYTEALQSFQPHGPYYLGGTSFGGTLAFAIAQELISQGETVAFLALIDTPSPDNMPYEFDETSNILFYLLEVGNNLDLKGFDSLDEEQQLDFYLRNSGDKFKSRKELKIMLQLFKANLRAMRNYQPSVYGGKIHFFLARQRDEFNAKTPAHGWIGLAEKGIEIYSIPGNHITMNKEPNVQYLGECLQECLKHIT